jgi:hypothetical protein
MAIVARAYEIYSAFTTAAGLAEQIIQVDAAGVLAGQTAGNLYLNGPSANQMQGKRFKVNLGGWIKAHGTSQTVKLGLLWQAWSGLALTGSPADTFTTAASGTLTAGTYYDFCVEQEFFGDVNAGTIVAVLPSVMICGAAVSISTVTAALTCPNLNTALFANSTPSSGYITPPLGNNTPAISFCASVLNSVSDTSETCAITEFTMSME